MLKGWSYTYTPEDPDGRESRITFAPIHDDSFYTGVNHAVFESWTMDGRLLHSRLHGRLRTSKGAET
jgi:hypothetical protein